MSMLWFINGVTGLDSYLPIVNTQLSYYYGPDPAYITGYSGQEYGLGDPNDTGSWAETFVSTAGPANPYTTTRIATYLNQSPGAFIHGSSTNANVIISPFRIERFDRRWFSGPDISAAQGEAVIGAFTTTVRTVHRELYASQNEEGNRVPTGLIGGQPYFWGETITVTPVTTDNATLAICGLYKVVGVPILEFRLLGASGAGGGLEVGVTVGMDMADVCRKYMVGDDAGAVAFSVLPATGLVPDFDPARIDSVEGMRQLQKMSMTGEWTYWPDAAGLWWPVGDVAYWDRDVVNVSPSGGWLNLQTAPTLTSDARVQAGLIPAMR